MISNEFKEIEECAPIFSFSEPVINAINTE